MCSLRTFDVLGMGHALVDQEVEVDHDFLSGQDVEEGHRRLVTQQERDSLHEALGVRPIHRCSGGSVANTVVGVAGLGGSGGFIGMVGPDENGALFRRDLDRIDVPLLCDAGQGSTGTCTVMITRGAQRTMMTHLGISANLRRENVDFDAVAQARYLLIEGYLLPHDGTLEASLEAISVAKNAGAKVALSLSDPFVVERCEDLLWSLMEDSVDLLLLNALEGQALTGLEDPHESAEAIHRHSVDVALTAGPEGSVLVSQGESWVVRVVPVEAVDTTGAGDMYAAGLLYGLTHGMGWAQSGRLGSHLASKLISGMGSRLATPISKEEISRIAADH